MTRQDITHAKGATLSQDITLEGVEASAPCELAMDLRISPQGRVFARLSSSGGHLSMFEEDDEWKARLFAAAATFESIPALNFYYTLHATCPDKKYVLSRGRFDLLPSDYHEDTIPWVGELVTETKSAPRPYIWSSNEALNICCGQDHPIYFNVSIPGGLKDLSVDAGYGKWRVFGWQSGEWHVLSGMAPLYNRDGTEVEKYRIEFVRFPKYAPYATKWDKGWWNGGAEDCASCGCCDDECKGFQVKVTATDALGQKTDQIFDVAVDGDSPLVTSYSESSAEGCINSFGSASPSGWQTAEAPGCALCPGILVLP